MSNCIHIASAINKKYAMSQEDARQLFPALEKAITQHQPLDLSFDTLENCSTLFLNELLGKLYLAHGEDVDQYVHFIQIDAEDTTLPIQLERLRKRALKPDIYKPIFEQALASA